MAFRTGKDREWTLETAMEQALRLLGPRDLSALELRRKLSQRSVPNELIQAVEETL